MSQFVRQKFETIKHGETALGMTIVRLTGNSDTVTLPTMRNASTSVVQLRRAGDVKVSVTQSDINTATISNGVKGAEILLVSLHQDPVPYSSV